MQVTFLCYNYDKGKSFYALLPPFYMNRRNIFNHVHKITYQKLLKAARCIFSKKHLRQ